MGVDARVQATSDMPTSASQRAIVARVSQGPSAASLVAVHRRPLHRCGLHRLELQLRLTGERGGSIEIDGLDAQPLARMDRRRRHARNLSRGRERVGDRILTQARREPDAHRFLGFDDATGVDELACDVVAHESAQRAARGHVRDEPVADLHHREPRVGGDVAELAAERELQATTKDHLPEGRVCSTASLSALDRQAPSTRESTQRGVPVRDDPRRA